MTEGYLRQRRNLLSISILLLLAILGGAENVSLLPLKLKHPEVAEYFAWAGFLYFWYRVYMYTPSKLTALFKNEIILSLLKTHSNTDYNYFSLSDFIGSITITSSTDSESADITLNGNTSSSKNFTKDYSLPLSQESIFSFNRYINVIFNGKVVTDYFLPHFIAIITILVGIDKYYPDALITLFPVILVSALLYSLVSKKK